MKRLTMVNGSVIESDIRVECVDCDSPHEYFRKDDDPKSVVRCKECGKKHSQDSLTDVNVAGVSPE
jgi:ribosomal protein S27E